MPADLADPVRRTKAGMAAGHRAARGAKPWAAGRNVDRLDLRAAPGGRESLDPPGRMELEHDD
jgi:hypothetical protein